MIVQRKEYLRPFINIIESEPFCVISDSDPAKISTQGSSGSATNEIPKEGVGVNPFDGDAINSSSGSSKSFFGSWDEEYTME